MHIPHQQSAWSGRMAIVARPVIVLGLTAIYAVCFAAIKAGLPYAPPLRFAGLRALLGGAALLGLMALLRRPLLPPRRSWPEIVALGLTSTTLAVGAMFLSPERTGAGIASVLGNTQPVIVPALAAIFLGERMTRSKWIALALGMIGVALIASPALAGPDAYGVSGAGLALVASGGLAVGSVIVKRIGPTVDLLALTAWQLIIGSLPLLAVSLVAEHNAVVAWNTIFVGLLLFLALIGTAFANAVWYWLVRHDDVGRLTMFFFLVPVFGLAIAALAFGETIGLLESLGVAVTLAAIGAIAWESWSSHVKTLTRQQIACSCGLPGCAGTAACGNGCSP